MPSQKDITEKAFLQTLKKKKRKKNDQGFDFTVLLAITTYWLLIFSFCFCLSISIYISFHPLFFNTYRCDQLCCSWVLLIDIEKCFHPLIDWLMVFPLLSTVHFHIKFCFYWWLYSFIYLPSAIYLLAMKSGLMAFDSVCQHSVTSENPESNQNLIPVPKYSYLYIYWIRVYYKMNVWDFTYTWS